MAFPIVIVLLLLFLFLIIILIVLGHRRLKYSLHTGAPAPPGTISDGIFPPQTIKYSLRAFDGLPPGVASSRWSERGLQSDFGRFAMRSGPSLFLGLGLAAVLLIMTGASGQQRPQQDVN